MRNGGFDRVISRNMAACSLTYIGCALTAEIFSGNASCYLLLGGIIFWVAMPYTRWGLKIMHRQIDKGRWVAVDFHPRAKKDYLFKLPKTKGVHSGKKGGQPLLAGRRPLYSAVFICSRLASNGSGRHPDNPG